MGNSLSQESQCVLEAATAGDVGLLKQRIEADAPRLLDSVTLLKRRSVLHLAAKSGHPGVIAAVLEPLLDAVREEYYDAQARLAKEQAAAAAEAAAAAGAGNAPQQQQQQPADAAAPSDALPPPAQQQQQQQQQQRPPPQRQQQAQRPDLQLPSFKRLRKTVNARDLYRRTPLIVAAKQGHLECTRLLVDAASNLFAMDREGNTSLHYAALHGHAAVVEYLVQRSSERGLSSRYVNKRNLSGFTPLHYAVWSCRAGVVVPLLAAGADLSAANDRVFDAWVPCPIGSTPLHLAVLRSSAPMALLLLQHYMLSVAAAGAMRAPLLDDPRHAANLYGMNPAQLAAHRNNRQLAQLLMPSLALSRVLQVAGGPEATGLFSPPSLRAIAAAAVQQHLAAQLDSLAALAEAEEAGVEAGAAAAAASSSSRSDAPATAAEEAADAASSSCRADQRQQQQQPPPPVQQQDELDLESALQDRDQSQNGDDEEARGQGASSTLARAGTQTSSAWYEELCCVCWECEVSAALQPCAHALCMGCAKQLVACSSTAGVTCPLCRGFIAEFGLVPRREQQAAGAGAVAGGKPPRCKGFLLAGSGI